MSISNKVLLTLYSVTVLLLAPTVLGADRNVVGSKFTYIKELSTNLSGSIGGFYVKDVDQHDSLSLVSAGVNWKAKPNLLIGTSYLQLKSRKGYKLDVYRLKASSNKAIGDWTAQLRHTIEDRRSTSPRSTSSRYKLRLKLSRPFQLGVKDYSAFSQVEVSYDFPDDRWARTTYGLGVKSKISENLDLKLIALRLDKIDRSDINALMLSFIYKQ